ncbi:amidohydrolase family protein [Comamonas sp. J-3]|uniref:amidohydrolase family protein n=1 Tax=Comamonas trifloxystrobinivorans TaxID=3350256 RepID=UPI0037272361
MDYCLSPLPNVEPASFVLPPGACDTHAHVVAEDMQKYPMVANRSYTPHPATEGDYLQMLHATGMERGVLVQISVYGTDNRYMLEVLSRHPQKLRGIAVVDADISEQELERMHHLGVRGLRINVLFGGGIGFAAMEKLAQKIAPLGWHMQFLLDAAQLPELMPRLEKLPVIGVVDHMGHTPVASGLHSPAMQSLLHLMKDKGWWVKLSGAYRIGEEFPGFADVVPWAQQLYAAAPEQCVWGSDWPHVALQKMPDTGALRNQLPRWLQTAEDLQQVLVHNPQKLYGFEDKY